MHIAGYLALVLLVLLAAQGAGLPRRPAGTVRPLPRLLVRAEPQGHADADRRGGADFLRRQVLTSRNVRGGWLVDFALGGLNYQIEHHLFPSMPRPNLRRAQAIVRAFCQRARRLLPRDTLLRSYAQALRHLHEVGQPLRATVTGLDPPGLQEFPRAR